MFDNYKKAFKYFKSDYYRYCGKHPGFLSICGLLTAPSADTGLRYLFWFRFASELKSRFDPIGKCCFAMCRRMTKKYQLDIRPGIRIGYGLFLAHYMNKGIAWKTVIGNNCDIGNVVTIGVGNDGGAAVIGNNVYIGPHVCIIGSVRIGDNVTIGAGSVVVKDIPDNATVAGNPARVLNYNNPGRLIKHKWKVEDAETASVKQKQ